MSAELQRVLAQIEHIELARAQGGLPSDLYAEARRRLDAALMLALATDAPGAAPGPAAAPRARWATRQAAAVAALAVMVGGTGYAWKGSPRQGAAAPAGWAATSGGLTPPSPAAGASAPHALGNDAMVGMVQALAERLKAKPDDGEGWAMLARSYTTLGQVDASLPAYAQALKLAPKDAELMADYADALALKQGRQLTGEPLTWVKKALALDPRQPKALLLAGTEAYNRQDMPAAIRYWEQVVAAGPAGSGLVEQARSGLADARQASGASPAPVAAPAAPSVPQAKVGGMVRLAPELVREAKPDDTVFVFARAAEGPRMPLALIQRRVRDLPLRFELDDSQAMNPAAKLSSAQQVVVTARVSRSGQAQPQPGDLEGASAAVALGRSDLDVVIGARVR
ncbi:tetratricopeptide repeat protein [Roseateles sp. BYS87W]|uniref:Tetratricopeptide repeat protein n=1 Tax=Pelomonas baiyunensis TaxID=3299026 RepID=A0ABW7H2A5_9BURK